MMTVTDKLFFSRNKYLRSLTLKFLDNQNIFLSIIIPYISFIILNLSLVFMGATGFLILAFLDSIICISFVTANAKENKS